MGFRFRRSIKIGAGVRMMRAAAAAACALLLAACGEDPDQARTKTAIHFAKQEAAARAQAFKTDHDAIIASIRSSMATKKWDDASLEASKWRTVGGDEIKALDMTIDAEKEKIARALQVEKNKIALAERLKAEKEQAAADKADRAFRKKQGVRIGMTQQQVAESSWGRPQQINSTTYTFGVHEQWVYPGNQYLYFENGKLTTIQNTR